MSGTADQGHYADSDWVDKWHIGETGWHSDNPAQFLIKNGTEILGDKKKRIFAPLCGKAVDMVWMYEKGHEVVGVEIAEKAVKEFFEENKIDYDVVGKLYKSKDGRLSIFADNLFNIPSEQYGKFDIIWDCKSFVAINLSDHQRYLDLMHDIMTPDCAYYLQTVEFDESLWPGPPHSTKDEVVKSVFGKASNIEILEDFDLKKPAAINESKMLDSAKEQSDTRKTTTDKPKVVDPAMVTPFWKCLSSREVNSKSQKLSPAMKSAEKSKASNIEVLEDFDLKKPAAINESKMLDSAKEQSDTRKPTTDKPKVVDPAMVALGQSSYIFLRWYKMVF